MSPALRDGDLILVKRISEETTVGEIILFERYGVNIKRIAPFPSYLEVSEETLFVRGDNEWQSYDSRHFGPIKKNTVIGEVIFVGRVEKRPGESYFQTL